MFQFSPNMACQVNFFNNNSILNTKDKKKNNFLQQWHEEEDNVTFCSLTKVKNYAYTISDMCCEHYDLALLPNRHVPANIADEDRYVVLPKVDKTKDKQVINNFIYCFKGRKLMNLGNTFCQTPVKKYEDDDDEVSLKTVPRLPNTFCKFI